MTDMTKATKTYILNTYCKLHEKKLGQHWIWAAMERIAYGEPENEVMADYGFDMPLIKIKESK